MLLLQVPPKIATFGVENPLDAGDMTQLTCLVAQGDTPIQISWVFHGQDSSKASQNGISVIKNGPRSSSLIIESLTSEHTGNYTCSAKNAAGSANQTAEIIVTGICIYCNQVLATICMRLMHFSNCFNPLKFLTASRSSLGREQKPPL